MVNRVKLILVAVGTYVLLISFQNCGQPNFQSLDMNSLADLQSSQSSGGNGLNQPTNQWSIGTPISFTEGSGETIDLSKTLPSGTKLNGRFYVDTNSGPDLPAGMTLSPSGVLSVGAASVVEINGVVFAYDEP